MKVIDSSSIAKFVNKEQNWEAVEEILRSGCISLEFAVAETGNSLWKRVHRKQLDRKRAQRYFAGFVDSRPFSLAVQEELLVPAFKIACSQDLPLCDALFLSLSMEKGLPLVTSDPSQADAARRLGIEIHFIA